MATISWKSTLSGDWSTAALWLGGVAPGPADDAVLAVPGDFTATIAEAESLTVNSVIQTTGTTLLLGNLTVHASITLGAGGIIEGGSTLAAQGGISGTSVSSTLLNQGVIDASTPNGTLQLDTPVLTNQGVFQASNSSVLFITSNTFTNLTNTVLTGGTYEADNLSAIDFAPGPYNFSTNKFPLSAVSVDAATIILNGPSSTIFGFNPNALTNYDSLETSLTSITAAGVLDILGGRDYITTNSLTNAGVLALAGGTLNAGALNIAATGVLVGYGTVLPQVANAGLIEAQLGTLTLSGGIAPGGTLQTDAQSTLAFTGTYAQPLINAGTIEATGGTLHLTGTTTGTGGYFIEGGVQEGPSGVINGPTTTLDLAGARTGIITFNGAGGALKLESPASFTGSITGFGTGDTIDLAGIVSTGVTLSGTTLDVMNGGSIAYALALNGNYNAATFTRGSDGAGGTTLTLTGVAPQDFQFEGPTWQTRTLTWSYAAYNYGSQFDSAHPFSSLIDPATQAAAAAVITDALGRWTAISGITFIQVADSSNSAMPADIRIGWGDLLSGGGEIGQAAYQYIGNTFEPDTIVRLEDPSISPLVANPGVIGGLVYSSFASTLYQIAVHELGHALGLDHSTNPNAVMNPTASGIINQDATASDIAGIQALYATPPAPAGVVTVSGANGDLVTITFADTIAAAPAAAAVAPLNTGVALGSVVPFTFTTGAAIPTLAGGTSGLLLMHTGGAVALPTGYAALATDTATPVTVIGGAANGQVIVAGSGGLAFNAGAGAGSVFAAGGNNLISVYPGAGDQYIQSGAGDDTIVVLGANDTVNAGTGHNQILTGRGNDIINSTGADLIAAGDIGAATITAGGNSPVAFFGPGSTTFNAGTGNATVVSTVGQATINVQGGTQIWLGSNRDVVNSTGADTIIGSSGAATVNATAGNGFMFSGSGALRYFGGSGVDTILGSATGTATLQGGSGSIIDLSYHATRYIGGTGADTIAGFGGSITVTGGAGGGLYLGGPGGANSITGGSGQSIILGGGAGDVLTAGSGAGDVIQAAGGAETISALGTNGAHKIYAGTGPNTIILGGGATNVLTSTGNATITAGTGIDLIAFVNTNHPAVTIAGFSAARDYLSFGGFGSSEKTNALAGATTSGGSETLILSDGTQITLQGFTGLTAANIL